MANVEPAEHGFGLFGPDFGYPGGGLCLSTFLIVERDDRLLVGQMREDPIWEEQWQPNLAFYNDAMREAAFDGFRLPATYLRTGEGFAQAAVRVWTDQLGFSGAPDLPAPTMISEAGPSRRSPGYEHWDVLAIFRVPGLPIEQVPDHWQELRYVDPATLSSAELVMLHSELVEHLGIPT